MSSRQAVRPVDKPIAWIGGDRLLLKDRTIYGLQRRVYARRDGLPDFDGHLDQAEREAKGARVDSWLVTIGEFNYLWIIWKAAQ